MRPPSTFATSASLQAGSGNGTRRVAAGVAVIALEGGVDCGALNAGDVPTGDEIAPLLQRRDTARWQGLLVHEYRCQGVVVGEQAQRPEQTSRAPRLLNEPGRSSCAPSSWIGRYPGRNRPGACAPGPVGIDTRNEPPFDHGLLWQKCRRMADQ
jgi:hypothetical protein